MELPLLFARATHGQEEMGDFGDYIVVQSEEKVFSMEEVHLVMSFPIHPEAFPF